MNVWVPHPFRFFLRKGWETTNPIARKRCPPHRRWLQIITPRRRTMEDRTSLKPQNGHHPELTTDHCSLLPVPCSPSTTTGEAMRNITVTIPDDSYCRARVWAAERNTSISAVVRRLLESLPGLSRAAKAFPARNSNPINTQPVPSPAPEANSPEPE